MRIVFIGSVDFSLSALELMCKMKSNIVGVITKRSSSINSDFVDLSVFSEKNRIPWRYFDDVNSLEAISWIQTLEPDIIFCFGWSQILRTEVLGIARNGVVGFHPSALPRNRGRHPIIWALVLGLEHTGSTFFFMDSGTDSGDIISQSHILINDNDCAKTLYRRITNEALDQIEQFLPKLELGTIVSHKQDHTLANVWRKRSSLDGIIDWRMSAKSIHNLVRGLSHPYIGAHFIFEGNEIKVWKTELIRDFPSNIEPGKVLSNSEKGSIVKCGDGAIQLLEIEPKYSLIPGSYL